MRGFHEVPTFHYLSWSTTPTNGRDSDDFQPWALIKRLFEESELVSGDSEAIRKFSDKYIVPEKLVAEYVEHLAQIKMRKEKKKEETERERMERPGVPDEAARQNTRSSGRIWASWKKKHWLISWLGNLNERLASWKYEKFMPVLAG